MRNLFFFSKLSLITHLRRPFTRRPPCVCRNATTTTTTPLSIISSPIPPSLPHRTLHSHFSSSSSQDPQTPNPISSSSSAIIHSNQENPTQNEELEEEEDGPTNEFLSRFVWVIRGKLSDAYPNCPRETLDGMLLIICQKVVAEMERGDPSQMLGSAAAKLPSMDLSQDLWNTIWEVGNSVLEDMRRDRRREEMKKYLHSDDVKEMVRFSGEVGIRGDLLRELRFKWAREKLEENEFYRNLERVREENREQKEEEGSGEVDGEEEKGGKFAVLSLPQRRGKVKYKIYGLDLSDPKWQEVADRIHESEKLIATEEPKPIVGKCKHIEEKILALDGETDDPSPVLAEWVELLQPTRVDWLALLDRIKEHNLHLYFKVAELVLTEESFETSVREYSKLIDALSKADRIGDAERILQKMTEKGIEPDILTSIILVHMYSKAGNLDRAKDAFESLRKQGFQPDLKAYNSMITAYVKVGLPKSAESLIKEMEAKNIKPTKEMYMELLRAFAERGQVDGAQRIVNTMQFAGIQPTLESCTLLVEAYGQAGDPDQARVNFDHMMKAGHKPDDRCAASMIAAYAKKNLLDKALDLLLNLEKEGFQPGVSTYTVLVDWLGKLQLVDEAERLLSKITEKAELPFEIHLSLCDMYSRVGSTKKALKALKIIEGRKELLRAEQFERTVTGLLEGGLVKDARRIHDLMQAQGFASSEAIRVSLMAAETIPHQRPTTSR